MPAARSARNWCARSPPSTPAHLTLVDSAEYQLYLIDLDLAEHFARICRAPPAWATCATGAGSTRSWPWRGPELVFHAAAYKHVPMVEANPTEGVLTNVIGTRNLAEACRASMASPPW